MDGQYIDAIGIFKSEHKDTFIKITEHGASYGIESQRGININKLDKGCIIYNTQRNQGMWFLLWIIQILVKLNIDQ